ncbi:XAC2610-related protein [Lysobacter silvisoli]|uniref:DUF1311 domain-containing protein n=1 Tax=Lysobacter silvisoli TaxID=2293254 RepID=A0A371K2Q0_9GAMM|nr:lysozyme inhibitor LprI family protein [Lysobacter silvisoli]RDZ28152.1 DUF1311 domain-containing protein [Lysobacter silvisoli]
MTAAAQDAPAQARCLDEELAYQRRTLDTLYQERTLTLGGAQRHALQVQQAAWQKETERLCAAGKGEPAAAGAADPVCLLQRIAARFDVLADEAPAPVAVGVRGTPDVQGRLDLQLVDTKLSLRSDGCGGVRALVCDNARLQVSASTLEAQTLSLPQVVFAPKMQSGDSAYWGPLSSGFVQRWYSFIRTDINDDGRLDLMVWTGFDGSYGDPSYTYYLYDTGSKQLVENRALAELTRGHTLSRIADGRLYLWYRSGPCERGEKTIDASGAAPKIAESKDYSTCTKAGQ